MVTNTEHVVHSQTLGVMPCEIVGRNSSHLLIRIPGVAKPMRVARATVFKLEEGQTIEDLRGDHAQRDVEAG